MHFFKTLLAGAALVASTVAQGELAFTSFPPDVVTAGTPVDLTWSGGDSGAPVTITLKKGPSDNLEDVGVLTSSATGGSYTWTPSEDLESGDNYALEIGQGDTINYTGQFSVEGKTSGDDDAPAPTYGSGGPSTTVVTVTLTTNCESSTAPGKHPTNVPRPTSRAPQPPRSSSVPTGSHPPARPTETTPPYTGGAASTVFSTPLALAVAALGAFAYIN